MTDIYDPKKRSEIMGRVSATGTKPELLVRQVIHGLGYRFRLHGENLPGKPDIVFSRRRKVIFIHGCFWHGHKHCPKAKRPTTNSAFWEQKLSRNIERDQQNLNALKEAGWESLVIWECETRNRNRIETKVRHFLEVGLAEQGESLDVKVFDFFPGVAERVAASATQGWTLFSPLIAIPTHNAHSKSIFPPYTSNLQISVRCKFVEFEPLLKRTGQILFCFVDARHVSPLQIRTPRTPHEIKMIECLCFRTSPGLSKAVSRILCSLRTYRVSKN